MKTVTGRTWLQQLCNPFWGGTAFTAAGGDTGKPVDLGFNIGEYVDSRDLDALGYAEAIRTPEVKVKDDLRGPYLLFNKGRLPGKGKPPCLTGVKSSRISYRIRWSKAADTV